MWELSTVRVFTIRMQMIYRLSSKFFQEMTDQYGQPLGVELLPLKHFYSC